MCIGLSSAILSQLTAGWTGHHQRVPAALCNSDGGAGELQKRKRRHRTIFTEYQLDQLERMFHKTHYPDVLLREQLAVKVQLKEERVEVDYTNNFSLLRKSIDIT